ncbi:MAG: ribonuclease H-like domain-containing protein, partial [Anaerolineae bacterium]|nr:ribonuclease H-like domain-containing protein [Anaerolineae bacterium]
VVFDLETQRDFDEVGGRGNIRRMGLSVAVTYSMTTGQYHHYTEANVADLVAELQGADLIVGFNLLNFDYEVLRGYTDAPLAQRPTVDMLDHLHRRLGFRVGLDNVAEATMSQRKTADGMQAIRWWREGKIKEIAEYCQQDVEVTRRLYEFGRRNKYVQYRDRNFRVQRVLVNW